MMAFNAFNSIGRSKTDDPKFLQNEIRHMSLGNNLMEEEINPHIKQSIDSLLGPNSLEEEPMQEERSSSLKMKEETEIRSSILWFPIRYSIPCYCVYNLFSNFGNISCIVAKNALDGTKLCNSICKMSIYYSNLDNVDLKHETTEGFSL